MGDDALLDHIGTATEAIDAIEELREQLSAHPQAPPHVQRSDRDSMLAKAEHHVRGVRDELIADLGTETAVEVIKTAVEVIKEADNELNVIETVRCGKCDGESQLDKNHDGDARCPHCGAYLMIGGGVTNAVRPVEESDDV